MKKIDWYIVTRKAGSLLTRYIIAKNTFPKHIRDICGYNLRLDHYKYVDKINYFDRNETDLIYRILKQELVADKSKKLIKECDKYGKDFVKFSKDLSSNNLEELSNKKLIAVFKTWEQKYALMWAFVNVGFLSISALTEEILNLIGKIDDQKFIQLIFDKEETYLSKRQSEIMSLAADFYRNKKIKTIFLKYDVQNIKKRLPPEEMKKIKTVFNKYIWMGNLFLQGKEQSFSDFLYEIKQVVAEDPVLKLKLNKQELIINLQKQEKVKSELVKTKKLNQLVKELIRNSHKRTEELKYLQMGEFYSKAMLNEISKRLKLSFKQVTNLTSDEIVGCLSGNIKSDINLIEKRKNNFDLILIDNKLEVFNGDQIKKSNWGVDYVNVDRSAKIIKGKIASKGKALGPVKVILNSSQLNKIEEGDVLVTLMTTPDYMTAIKKVSAIVTDDGGITCHAAIISRELKKPCVISTKIATKILKDGDKVEVDADNGLIRKT